jgi:hypothetical protein
MWKLIITAQTAKANLTRTEYFNTVEGAADRRTFLKSIEGFGSTNMYSLVAA